MVSHRALFASPCFGLAAGNRQVLANIFIIGIVNGCVIVIRNVPCYECPVCGEIIFSDDVSAKLEMIVQKAKSFLQDVSVIDYSRAA